METILYDSDTPQLILQPNSELEIIHKKIAEIIQQKKALLNLTKTDVEITADEKQQLTKTIHSEKEWKTLVKQLFHTLSYEFKEDYLAEINLPFWNEITTYFDREELPHIYVKPAHSYITQLLRKGLLTGTSLSVMGILITKDNLLVLGMRGGHVYSDMLMLIPAGSLQYNTSLKDVLFTELKEECGIDKATIRLQARIYDQLSKGWSYIFTVKSDLTFSEVLETWSQSVDRAEHAYLVPIINKTQFIEQFIKENKNIILQPAVEGLLAHLKTLRRVE